MSSSKYNKLFKLTIKNIFRRKLRSILTILSVIIGIASVIALVLLSDGLLNTVNEQFDKMGGRVIIVLAGNFQGNPFESGRLSKENMLNIKDSENIEKIPAVENVFAMNFLNAQITYRNQDEFAYLATLPVEKMDDAFDFFDVSVSEGKTFNGKEGNNAVIGDYIAKKMFDREIKTGNKIKINDMDFRVLGILEPIGNEADDSTIYITRKAGDDLLNYEDSVNYIMVRTKADTDNKDTVKRIERLLTKTREEENFMIISADDFLELITRLLTLIKVILATIASISVVVGSLGVINSVYTSVLERTREIGVLKSIGAKINDITFIFVLESLLLSLAGGVIGFGLGVGIAKGVSLYAASAGFDMFTISITVEIVLLALILSVIVGIVAGLFPARSAAKLNPVNALRGSM
jgi:putative ABC transport system permease protein